MSTRYRRGDPLYLTDPGALAYAHDRLRSLRVERVVTRAGREDLPPGAPHVVIHANDLAVLPGS